MQFVHSQKQYFSIASLETKTDNKKPPVNICVFKNIIQCNYVNDNDAKQFQTD